MAKTVSTKKTRKPKRGMTGGAVNKSLKIREYLQKHPDAKPKDAAGELSIDLGTAISPAFVSQIKTKLNAGRGKVKAKRGRKPGAKGVKPSKNGSAGHDALHDALAFVEKVGMTAAEAAMDLIKRIRSSK